MLDAHNDQGEADRHKEHVPAGEKTHRLDATLLPMELVTYICLLAHWRVQISTAETIPQAGYKTAEKCLRTVHL